MWSYVTAVGILTLGLAASGNVSFQTVRLKRALVAILRPDAIIVPFAELRDNEWHNEGATLWSPGEALDSVGPPWFTNGGPIPTTWLTADTNGTVTSARAGKAVPVTNHCEVMWGLARDSAQRPVNDANPPGIVGIAATGATRVSGFVNLAADALDARRLLDTLKARFERAEDDEIANDLVNPRESAEVRRMHPVVVESWVRSREPVGGHWLYHARLARRYPPVPGARVRQGCESITTFEVWVFRDTTEEARDRGRVRYPNAASLTLDDCDRKFTRQTAPVGVVEARGRTYVVAVAYGYEGESYQLFETDGRTLRHVFTAKGGGC